MNTRKKELYDYDDKPNLKSEKWYEVFHIRNLFKRKKIDKSLQEKKVTQNIKPWEIY